MKRDTFDDFTRILATSTSRRHALRRIAGMLGLGTVGGVALAELTPGVALASGGNSDCAHFCNAVFAPGSARGQCKSDAAHGTGLCYSCGPKSSGGSQAICCPADSNGQCTSYSSATCCDSGQTCTSGTCVATCTGVVLSNGSCAKSCTADSDCSSGFCDPDVVCNNPVGCIQSYCSDGVILFQYCYSDSTCPQGQFCDGSGACVITTS